MKVTMSLRFEVSKDCEFYSFAALRIHVSPECRNVLLQLGGYHLIERGPVSMKVYIYIYISENYWGQDRLSLFTVPCPSRFLKNAYQLN